MKKLISLILILSFVLTAFGTVGCKNNGEGNKDNNQEEPGINKEYETTDIYLVNHGVSSYSILVPENADSLELFSADELQSQIKNATGAELPIVKDSQITSGASYISLGKTKLSKDNNISISDNYKKDGGYKIARIDKNVFLYGNDSYGTGFAVYDFLELQFGYKFYSIDEIYIEKNDTAKLRDINYEYVPYTVRQRGTYSANSPESALRYRAIYENAPNDWPLGWPHSYMSFIAPSVYQADHPDWFDVKSKTLTAGAICLTNTELIKEMAKVIVEQLDKSGYRRAMLGQADTWDRCTCEDCKASDAKLTQSGTNLYFANRVADEMDRIYKEQGRADFDYELWVLAYYQNESAPVVKKNGQYEPIDECLKANKHIGVQLCLFQSDISEPFYSDKNELAVFESEGWRAITDKFSMWIYRGYFVAYEMMFVNDWAYIGDWIRATKKLDAEWTKWDNVEMAMLSEMRNYVTSQLCYNVNQNVNDLISDFINAYYKEAAPFVQQWFDEITTHLNYRKAYYKSQNIDFGVYTLHSQSKQLYQSENWPQELLLTWNNLFDEAENAIKNSNKSELEKEILEQRLKKISVFPEYWNLKFYKTTMSTEEYKERSKKVLDDAYSVGYDPEYVYLV